MRPRLFAAALLMTLSAAAPAPAQEPDWSAASKETLAHLQAMIRLNTVNPPGNELQVARHLDSALKAAGIETHLFEPAPGRGALVARLRGTGSKRPVLIMGHMDVVGVERDKWSVDPFAAEIRDGYLYGRGAIDDKGMLAANLETMLLLKRNVIDKGGTLSRDVIFVANSDEEQSGEWGMGWLIKNHPELIRAEIALNEGGRTRIVGGKRLYVAVQNTEKVPHTVTVTARGPGGHASIPLAGNAISRLGRALARIGDYKEPVQVNPTTREFFSQLGRVWPNRQERTAMADVASTDTRRIQRGARVLAGIPVFDAVLRNGISPTIVQGGIRTNVIPTEASAKLNIRTLPGQSIDSVVRRLQRVVNDTMVTITVTDRGEDSPASDFHSPMFAAIRESVQALDATMTVVPYLSTGATDSARLRAWGMQAFGLLPFPMNQDDEDRMHGNDERIPLASLDFGTRMIYGAILRVAR
ncbi:MAG: M20/M25/M40 family metallo-hydrolase [Gemmatimonadaceae bacterium]|nr:M20/M25/M40 family metallo-hydrolase [Gemmatimonadaceae bacterium]NUR34495.1 M20/M25/M40 family metallo-hydrolase [Gemmatimonadaceae bacterium]NUS46761.1 M20/M25/M40 family metallo-hydrolase [Gemmatimonadaceae bacterium]